MSKLNEQLESFEQAFSDGVSSCRMICNCGKTYFDNYNSGISWEEGELEALRKDPDAVAMDGSDGYLSFDGRQYVRSCSCWHDRAEKIMVFVDYHGHCIAKYLSLEKKRKKLEADSMPEVKP